MGAPPAEIRGGGFPGAAKGRASTPRSPVLSAVQPLENLNRSTGRIPVNSPGLITCFPIIEKVRGGLYQGCGIGAGIKGAAYGDETGGIGQIHRIIQVYLGPPLMVKVPLLTDTPPP
jgi:hypothetical protein